MSRMIVSGVVLLPFNLNVCAVGDRVEPLQANIDGVDVVIGVPASMTQGAVGRSIYPDGWAWWTVDRLLVEASAEPAQVRGDRDMSEADIRDLILDAAQVGVRRMLNAYRWRLRQPEVHAVKIDPGNFAAEVLDDDGTREALPETPGAFFFHRMPITPPLDSSLNFRTLVEMENDLVKGVEPPMDEMIALDLEQLRRIGEDARADAMAAMCSVPRMGNDRDDFRQP